MAKPQPPQDQLIFALDVPSETEADKYVKELEPCIRFFKIGLELFMATGLTYARKLKERGFRVFLDTKVPEDIDEQCKRTVELAAQSDIDFLTIHGNGKAVRIAKQAKGSSPMKILCVTALTSLNELDICDIYGIDMDEFYRRWGSMDGHVLQRAQKAYDNGNGVDGLISSGKNLPILRKNLGDDVILVSPGIRPIGFSSNEHLRSATPREAISNGADYLVVGRPIRDAENKLDMAKKIIAEISEAAENAVPVEC